MCPKHHEAKHMEMSASGAEKGQFKTKEMYLRRNGKGKHTHTHTHTHTHIIHKMPISSDGDL